MAAVLMLVACADMNRHINTSGTGTANPQSGAYAGYGVVQAIELVRQDTAGIAGSGIAPELSPVRCWPHRRQPGGLGPGQDSRHRYRCCRRGLCRTRAGKAQPAANRCLQIHHPHERWYLSNRDPNHKLQYSVGGPREDRKRSRAAVLILSETFEPRRQKSLGTHLESRALTCATRARVKIP